MTEESSTLLLVSGNVRIFQLREKLYQGLSKGWYNVGGVMECEPANYSYCGFPDRKGFIIQSQEQGTDVLSLSKMPVKPGI